MKFFRACKLSELKDEMNFGEIKWIFLTKDHNKFSQLQTIIFKFLGMIVG